MFSILDLGNIKYKHNTAVHYYNNVNAIWHDPKITVNSIDSIFYVFDTLFYGPNGEGQSIVDNNFGMGLPTAFSLQGDMKISDNIYASALFIHPLKIFKNSLRRTPQIAVTPRYENLYI